MGALIGVYVDFYSVYLAKGNDGQIWALKVMKVEGREEMKVQKVLNAEAEWLSKLKHKGLLKIIDYSVEGKLVYKDGKTESVQYLALENAEEGEIFDFVAKGRKFTEPEARYYFHQLIDVLEYMHKNSYYHRDIKPDNILLDKNFHLKLADFGMVTTKNEWTTRAGTKCYMCPEILSSAPYQASCADLFSSAVTLFAMVTSHLPFESASDTDKFYQLLWEGDEFWKLFFGGDGVSEGFKDLFMKMTRLDPEERLTIEQVRRHPWFCGTVPSEEEIRVAFNERKEIIEDSKNVTDKKSLRSDDEFWDLPKEFMVTYEVDNRADLYSLVLSYIEENNLKHKTDKKSYIFKVLSGKRSSQVKALIKVRKSLNEHRILKFQYKEGDLKSFVKLFQKINKYIITNLDLVPTED